MKKLFIFLVLAVSTMTVSAQFLQNNSTQEGNGILVNDSKNYNRLYLGYAPQYFSSNVPIYDNSTTAHGFVAGYLHGFNITGKAFPLFLETGADLNFATGKDSPGVDLYYLAFSVPLNLAYKLSFKPGIWLEPYAGMAFKINALVNLDNGHKSVSVYDMNDDFKRFQFGGQIGLNLGYKKVNLNVGYHWDMPMFESAGVKMNTSSLILALGYNF